MTSNHDYNTPAKGVVDWHVPLNENFHKIDTDVEIRDAEENLAQYTPKEGAKFLATDTGVRYLGDGSQWGEMPPHTPNLLSIPHATADPAETENGQMWYRSDTGELKVQLANGPTTITSAPPPSPDEDDSADSGDGSQKDGIGNGGTLEVVPAVGAGWNTYEIHVDGNVTGEINTNSGDSVSQQSDGTTVIEGGVAYKDGKTEGYEIDGPVLCATLDLDGHLELNGQTISPPEC